MAQGHGMVLAMHLKKLLKNSQKFLHLMNKAFDNLNSIQCVQHVHEKLRCSPENEVSECVKSELRA